VKRLANFGVALVFVAASGLACAAIAANGGEQSVTGNLEDVPPTARNPSSSSQ
jgi:hypothetical protein